MTPPTQITPAERSASTVAHGIRQMTGRDPEEKGRAATPLELLFDLTFVVAFGNAGNEMAHLVAAGHTWAGVAGFCFAIFGITWAWINFSWFASAYDTDDWPYRLIGETGAVLAVAIPVLVFVITLFSLWAFLFRSPDKVHPITVTATCLVILTSVWMATAHVPISVALIVLCFAPALVVVAYELYGHRHQARALAERSTGARRRMRGVRLLSTDGLTRRPLGAER